MTDPIAQLREMQAQIDQLLKAAESKEEEALALREKAEELGKQSQLATSIYNKLSEDKREEQNEMGSKLMAIYEMVETMTGPDSQTFRSHIEEFAASFKIQLYPEVTEEEGQETANVA